jgi:hypothetical protein
LLLRDDLFHDPDEIHETDLEYALFEYQSGKFVREHYFSNTIFSTSDEHGALRQQQVNATTDYCYCRTVE